MSIPLYYIKHDCEAFRSSYVQEPARRRQKLVPKQPSSLVATGCCIVKFNVLLLPTHTNGSRFSGGGNVSFDVHAFTKPIPWRAENHPLRCYAKSRRCRRSSSSFRLLFGSFRVMAAAAVGNSTIAIKTQGVLRVFSMERMSRSVFFF